MPVRRLVPRYSLRTLAVFLLLATSGMGLWWHWEAWYCVRSVNEHTGPVYRVTFSRDCTRLVTLSEGADPAARVWDGETGRQLMAFKASQYGAPAFSRDGARMLAAGSDGKARLWDIPSGRQLAAARLPTELPLASAFSSSGPRTVTKVGDNTLRLRDGKTMDEFATLRGHESFVCGIALSAGGDRLLSRDQNGNIRVWDCEDGTCLAIMQDECSFAALSPDGALALTSRWDGTARIWDVDRGSCIAVLRGHRKRVKLVGWPAGGRRVLTYDCGQTVRLWETATGNRLATVKPPMGPVRAFSPDGERVATGSFYDRCDIWSVTTGEHLAALDPDLGEDAPRHHTDAMWDDCAFSSDGRRLVSVNWSGFLHIWRRRRPECWWGVFWLWEFWLTVAFAGLFCRSVVADRRRLAT